MNTPISLAELGWTPFFAGPFEAYAREGCVPGRVIAEHKKQYQVSTEHGEISARLSGRMRYDAAGRGDLPVVGDWVALRLLDEQPPRGVIHAVLPRKSKFSRAAAGGSGGEQPMAANVDTLFLVVGLDGNYRVRRIERYLATAWQSGADPVVLLTKADLCPQAAERVRETEAVAGVAPVHAVSVVTGEGTAALASYLLPGRTVALVGSSGVGKSTLINALKGEEVQRVREVRAADSRGRHTTTHRELFRLASGALLIDTPGMRELRLWEAEEGVSHTFADVEELAARCHFPDCTHRKEPGCAVREALRSGALDPARFESYEKLNREARRQTTIREAMASAATARERKRLAKMFGDDRRRR